MQNFLVILHREETRRVGVIAKRTRAEEGFDAVALDKIVASSSSNLKYINLST